MVTEDIPKIKPVKKPLARGFCQLVISANACA